MSGRRPTVSACILAHTSRGGLARLLRELDAVVDEIVIGVDAASQDDTLAIARSGADVVFRFEHVGPPLRARLLPLRHASGDWILALDEDEGLDEAFAPVLGELVTDPRYSHYWFPRRCLAALAPPAYLHAAPWYPDWQLRLFRNHPARVWHTGRIHSGYRVMGPGAHEDRTAILHYEALVLSEAERQAKAAVYRALGSAEDYHSTAGRERRPLVPGPAAGAPRPRGRPGRLLDGVEAAPERPATPPWQATLEARMPASVRCGEAVVVEVLARNTGRLDWLPPGSSWPHLNLSHHLLTSAGLVVRRDGERIPVPRIVAPGESVRFLFNLRAPETAGRYIVEWDLVSEGECWFAECGSRTARVALHVGEPAV
ncbi:MAG TPA: hypothetical protein VMX54_19010 [Vicinamibacteria bacterium]|nr:hypothetical protein [Vicinamibacteria bacterium]